MFALADLKLERLLDTFDEWAHDAGHDADVEPPRRFAPTRVPASPALAARPAQRRDPDDRLGDRLPARLLAGSTCRCSTRRAACVHDGGVVDSPGLYALGLPVLRRRKSTFIHGIEDDAREVIDHLARYLAGP